jgi:F0F1-type ATP synthase epsilon subunit
VAEPLRLVVWTPSETMIDVARVAWVHVALADDTGITVWPGHLPMLGETAPAVLRYADPEGIQEVALPAGIVQVGGNTVTLFLAGKMGEQASERDGGSLRFGRLSEALIASLAKDQRVHASPVDA